MGYERENKLQKKKEIREEDEEKNTEKNHRNKRLWCRRGKRTGSNCKIVRDGKDNKVGIETQP